jgi:hypothetical protein
MTQVFIIVVNEDAPSPALPEPRLDVPARRALFASLREVYGRELSDAERLDKVSTLAGRRITSMSTYGDMTMADAHRVLDILSTLRS